MVSDIFINFVTSTGLDIFWGLSPVFTVYLFSFFFSVFMAIVLGVATGKPLVGVATLILMLGLFAMIGSFPLWIVAIPLVILIFVYYYGSDG